MTAKARIPKLSPASDGEHDLLDHLPPRRRESLVAECIAARHPTLEGRVRVRWLAENGELEESWVPVLRNLAIREHDRVLLLCASNEPQPIVVGVVDGFARRPEPPQHAGVTLELKSDEVVRVLGERGQSLLEISRNAEGPVVRLFTGDTQLELPGKLRIKASEIELCAERGDVRIQANDDVVIQGEMVRLN